MTSSVVADFLVSQVLGIRPVISLAFAANLPHADYTTVVLLGLACGLLGALHNRGMFACKALYNRLGGRAAQWKLAVPFVLAGVCAFAFPDLMCGGDAIVEKLMAPRTLTLATMLALLAGKYLMTTLAFGSNAPGGTLFPMVVMGGLRPWRFCCDGPDRRIPAKLHSAGHRRALLGSRARSGHGRGAGL